jgi:TolA-binding protein
MNDHCDREWEIDALHEGRLGPKDAEAFERHVLTCETCKKARARDLHLRELARELPQPDPAALDLRRLRARVLRDVELQNPTSSTWRKWATFALILGFSAATILLLIRHRHAPPTEALVVSNAAPAIASAIPSSIPESPFAGTVTASDGARWSQSRDGSIERVQLDDGSLQLHVRHQMPGERFLVDVPDGQIEVRGTTFSVVVSNGVTSRIEVSEGVVSVRIRGSADATLRAGENWTRSAAISSSIPHVSTSAPVASSSSARHGSDEYTADVALMQSGNYDAAAKGFADFLTAHPNAPQAEDASYLEAAALARAGRPDAAALAAEHHLAAYPQSFHRKEASILEARAARDRGDCAKAREILAPWLNAASPDADAVATLRSCAAP